MKVPTILQAQEMDADDPTISYMLQAGARLCKCLGEEFIPYLGIVMPPLMQSAQLKPDVSISVSDSDEEDESDDEEVPPLPLYISLSIQCSDQSTYFSVPMPLFPPARRRSDFHSFGSLVLVTQVWRWRSKQGHAKHGGE